MPNFLNQGQVFPTLKIFRTLPNSKEDGDVIAESCLIVLDKFNVLSVHDPEVAKRDIWNPLHHFCLHDANSIVFKKIRSASGKLAMGRVVIKGLFRLEEEKVTFKMNRQHYKEFQEAMTK